MPSERFTGLAAVLEAIRKHQGMTQPALTALVGLGRSVVAQRVSELEAAGLIAPDGTAPSTGGRAPLRLRLKAEAGYLVGVDLASNELVVGVADLAGNLLASKEEHVDAAQGPGPVMAVAERLGDALLEETGVGDRVWAIGVGLPGPVAFDRGEALVFPSVPGWERAPVRQQLATRWAAPAWVDNRVNLLALGEMWANPAAARAGQILYLGGAHSMAAAIVVDGKLYRGAHGLAGTFGHVAVPEAGGAICACGNTGCLDVLVGGRALAREGRQLADSGQSPALAVVLAETGRIRPLDVTQAAEGGDPAARALLHRTGLLLGGSLAALVSFFDPELLIIGGGIARAGVHVLGAIRDGIDRRLPPTTVQRLRIETSTVDEAVAGVTGAFQLAIGEMFSKEHLPLWLDDRSPAGRPEVADLGSQGLSA